jgi:hypothetical protein
VRDELPVSLSEEQFSVIFSAGKALNFLRQWDAPVILDIDRTLDLSSYVSEASLEARRRLLALLNRDNLLLKSIKDIHDFVLLQRGDFASAFMDIQRDSVSRRLERIIQRFSDHMIQEIDFEVSNTDWQFAYRAIPPISAVFGQPELTAYKLVSGLLLRLKRTEFGLLRIRRQTVDRGALILIWEMHAIVKLIQDFLNVHVINKSYQKLVGVCRSSDAFDDILQAHGGHITAITRGCWLTESGRDCRKCLYQLLQAIDQFLPANLADARGMFRTHVHELYTAILQHPSSSRELGRPLFRTFAHFLRQAFP